MWAAPGICAALQVAQQLRACEATHESTLLLPKVWERREHLRPGRVLAWHLSLPRPPSRSVSTDLGHLDGLARRKEPGCRAGTATALSPQLSPATLWLLAPSPACSAFSSSSAPAHPCSSPAHPASFTVAHSCMISEQEWSQIVHPLVCGPDGNLAAEAQLLQAARFAAE